MKVGGYLLVDHSASPGLPEDVALASGYDPALVKEGKRFEADTLTCAHCKTSVVKNPLRTRERHTCFKCDFHYICDLCYAASQQPDYNHFPYEKLKDTAFELGTKGLILGGLPSASNPIPKIIRPGE